MNFKLQTTLLVAIFLFVYSSCGPKPKVIEESGNGDGTGVFSDNDATQSNEHIHQSLSNELHKVVVNEILYTAKYVYLYVTENEEKFWIATLKTKVDIGETYFYNGGLLKTNFESLEHHRLFEKIYLVNNLVPEDHGNRLGNFNEGGSKQGNRESNIKSAGSLTISELVNNYKNYEKKRIQISGECVKVNANIMGKNWIHIKDGSRDDYDLVITSNEDVQEGSFVTMRATVSINKDFGAGYQYDLILEDGIIVP